MNDNEGSGILDPGVFIICVKISRSDKGLQ